MEPLELLLKDPPFWGAFALFLGSLSSFVWSLAGLRALSSRHQGFYPDITSPMAPKKTPWRFPPPEQPPVLPPSGMEGGARPPSSAGAPFSSSPSAHHPSKTDSSVILSMVEEKLTDITKRLVTVESGKKDQPPAYLGPLLKRVADMEGDIKTLKSAFSQMAATQNAVNMNEIIAKISAMQKLLENLTGGTDVSKPS